ncbi:PP2C family protein-serine/threonine phosphatase [Paractinoplanes ferrugineus]|uniref:PPM-type phosphatase domain-containing protein n=1 Tax=Paractinoplanes ferrugineus TaxID=113564 RepID=A0A919J106_9ACTN|nr:PP2C family protein-serine/threonine phosphatase [Actinoplanes ferrugineus]GIE10449.1 hypothetical protein Afe05nite_22890 [Actinoplanes ferrugineus]
MDEAVTARWFDAVGDILRQSHLWRPDQLTTYVESAAARLGLHTTVWVVDYEQVSLRALPVPGRPVPPPVPIDGTAMGRAFTLVRTRRADGEDRWWVPMVNGTDRLGVLEVAGPGAADPEFGSRCETLAGLIGHLITTTSARGDSIDRVRRTAPMSTAAEMLWRMLPPLTASCEHAVVSAVLQPCYDVGGDGFDYAIDDETAQLLILDAAGKGLPAGLACSVALAAVRARRRAGYGLLEQARAADEALAEQFPDARFVTAVLVELDLTDGRVRYLNAGHPAPLVLRAGKLIAELSGGRRLPLGLGGTGAEIGESVMRPGDRLLCYSDGVTEARTGTGERFGRDRLIEVTERHAGAELSAPEVLRRLAHEVMAQSAGEPDDDATLLLLEWSGAAVTRTVPTSGERE